MEAIESLVSLQIMRVYAMKEIISACFLATIFLAPLGVYFFKFHGSISEDHVRWGEFGSYLSGVYGSLALIIVVYTTIITRKQFKIQNEDSVFFKFFDSIQNRIANSAVTISETEYTAHQSLKALVNRFYEVLSEETIEIARQLLCKSPEKVVDVHYMKIFEALKGDNFIKTFDEDRDGFVEDINSQPDFNSRWEQLKFYIGLRGTESERLRDALRTTGSVNLYKIPFEKRRQHYKAAVQRLSDEHGEFLDGYFRNVSYLLKFATKSINRDLYINFIKSQLTRYETIILFYLIAGRSGSVSDINDFRDFGILDRLSSIDC